MSNYFLLIDTAVQAASIALAKDDEVLTVKINEDQKESAAWIQMAIKELAEEYKISLKDLSAVTVSAGPGSYTGLRVGMSTAKGLCYALQIPFITVNTLQMMAAAASPEKNTLLCPMIDARRLEVFCAVYDEKLNEVLQTSNLILDFDSFCHLLQKNKIIFFGNGSDKFKKLTTSKNAVFASFTASAASLISFTVKAFKAQSFADVAYVEPFYGKEFYTPEP